MTNTFDVIVIGGGAAGMIAAGRAAERGRRVLLLEKNSQLGKKLSITGGGRCNICNAEENIHLLLSHYGDAKKFLFSSFSQFGLTETFDFFTSHGLPLKVEANKRVFPKTEKAADVVALLAEYLKKGNVTIWKNSKTNGFIVEKGKLTGVKTGMGIVSADTYILATGGKSHPETGSTGEGFQWLQDMGHTVQEPTPTIVPLAVSTKWVHALAGVALDDVRLKLCVEGEKPITIQGRILCTHFGFSGPSILNAAGKVADMLYRGEVIGSLDLFPTQDHGALDARITAIFDQHKNKTFKNVCKEIVPAGTVKVMLEMLRNIDPECKVHSITKDQRKGIGKVLKALPVAITGLMGYERAVVADGGVAIRELEGKTMRSRKYHNLFITGDLLHISRPSGGYSLQLCWTTGWVAGNNA